ncbi:unnamed protein product [Bursaphelenchus xylophilus]|uniref:Sugar transporter SWEET1 n=1 Tax=Bursaphelenchus xylophilus TaxID=6326 RepID=A0A1I7RH63_BURXY|nr:unnamed protein product [Bursaphelenchus xylophilus]CAG9115962.1 unnamed protein product [Bursaphelenchus xylophilus]
MSQLDLNATELVFEMAGESFSLLSVLSVSAIITTISLFFCGIPICIEIKRRKSTNEISGFPFIMGFLGGSFWLRYGGLREDMTMITVNCVGVTMMFLYILFFIFYSESKLGISIQLGLVTSAIGAMLVLVEMFGMECIDVLGLVCMTFNIVNFGAPLAGMKVVFSKKCCDSMPLPLCTANLLVSSQWCLYGVLVKDIYIIIPNGAGVVLAFFQISLFLFFPRTPGGKAPLSSCVTFVNDLEIMEAQDAKTSSPDIWLTRGSLKQSSLPTSIRNPLSTQNSAQIQDGSFADSASTFTTTAPTLSIISARPSDRPQFHFDRIREIDYLDNRWSVNELKRSNSAPSIHNI